MVVDNDVTFELFVKEVFCYVEAGVDIVVLSDMMDGRIVKICFVFDESGYLDVVLFSYVVKFVSGFYGLFREVADSIL